MDNQAKTQVQTEQELQELNRQFGEFLRTRGISAKCRLALSNIQESAKKQHAADKTQFEAVKARSAEENAEFVEFLHTKGIKAKCSLVIENIKKGAQAAPQKTAENIAKATAQARAAAVSHAGVPAGGEPCTAESLAEEFQAFLNSKGLDTQYTVEIRESGGD